MAFRTLKWRDQAASMSRSVRVTVRLTVHDVIELDAWAGRLGVSRSELIRDAVMVRRLKWAEHWERRRRAQYRELIAKAESWAPIDEVLADAREYGEAEALAAIDRRGQVEPDL